MQLYEVTSGYCPQCKSPVEYDKDTQIARCVSCDWKQEPNSKLRNKNEPPT